MSECELCSNYTYDDETDDWGCEAYMDEDDMAHLMLNRRSHCPYWHSNDEYRTVKHQSIGYLPGYSDSGYFREKEKTDYDGER